MFSSILAASLKQISLSELFGSYESLDNSIYLSQKYYCFHWLSEEISGFKLFFEGSAKGTNSSLKELIVAELVLSRDTFDC